MSRDTIFKCLIAFILGYLVARMMRGNGLSLEDDDYTCFNALDKTCNLTEIGNNDKCLFFNLIAALVMAAINVIF